MGSLLLAWAAFAFAQADSLGGASERNDAFQREASLAQRQLRRGKVDPALKALDRINRAARGLAADSAAIAAAAAAGAGEPRRDWDPLGRTQVEPLRGGSPPAAPGLVPIALAPAPPGIRVPDGVRVGPAREGGRAGGRPGASEDGEEDGEDAAEEESGDGAPGAGAATGPSAASAASDAQGASLLGEGARGGAADALPPPSRKDLYEAKCQGGFHRNFEAVPPDEALFSCLDRAKYCPSWNVYEKDKYLDCLERRGYGSEGPVARGLDQVLYDCIFRPRGLEGQRFREDPRTRNARWVDLDYSIGKSGLYAGSPERRAVVCLAQYRYLQGRFDHECVDPCSSMDPIRVQWRKTRSDFVVVPSCESGMKACSGARAGFCLGEHYACVPRPAGDCRGPAPLCLENGTGEYECVGGRYVCARKP